MVLFEGRLSDGPNESLSKVARWEEMGHLARPGIRRPKRYLRQPRRRQLTPTKNILRFSRSHLDMRPYSTGPDPVSFSIFSTVAISSFSSAAYKQPFEVRASIAVYLPDTPRLLLSRTNPIAYWCYDALSRFGVFVSAYPCCYKSFPPPQP